MTITINVFFIINNYFLFVVDAKAGGVSAPNTNIGTIIKHKMSIDEACKILNIEKNNLNKTIINEVKLLSMNMMLFFSLFCSEPKLFDNSTSYR